MSPPIRGQGGHLGFPISLKNTNLVEDVEILLPVKFYEISFNDFRGKVKNLSANLRPGRPSCFFQSAQKHKLGTAHLLNLSCFWTFEFRTSLGTSVFACFLSSFVEFASAVEEKKSKVSQPIRARGNHLVFPIGPKNTNLVEDVEILLPVKFRWILFSGFRGEVKKCES